MKNNAILRWGAIFILVTLLTTVTLLFIGGYKTYSDIPSELIIEEDLSVDELITEVAVRPKESVLANEMRLRGIEYYKDVEKWCAEQEEDNNTSNKIVYNDKQQTADEGGSHYSSSDFRRMGVIRYNGYKWTYYSQKVLPGGGLNIPGRHVDSAQFVCDGDGYIVLASRDYSKGTVLNTPFGRKGKVYDYCPTSGVIDVYTNY